MKNKLIAAVVAAVAVVSLSACNSRDNFRDVEGVKSERPDLIENYNNMDKHPNIGVVCIHGAGFATTTRDFTAIIRVEKWDAYCEAHKN